MTTVDLFREGLALASLFLVLGLWAVLGHALIG